MSDTLADSTDGTPMGDRSNWWYDEQPDRPSPDAADQDATELGTTREEYVANHLLRQWADKLCATTLLGTPDRGWTPHMAAEGIPDAPDHDPLAMHHERHAVELGPPEFACPKTAPEHVATSEYRQHYLNRRVNEATGYVTFGESTGIVLADIPTEQFQEVIDETLELYDATPTERDDVRGWALEQKRDGDQRDVDILEAVIARLADD